MKTYQDFMEGYVASADKKPAADGRMLPARKIQTNKTDPNKQKKEQPTAIGEKLSHKDDMGKWIDDFQKSDAPQFKGKSKDKRREMAIAAKLEADKEAGVVKEAHKVECSKCDGDGCSHCDNKGYHMAKEAYNEPQGQAKRLMSPLQKIRQDKEKADRDRDGKLKKEHVEEGVTGAVAGGIVGGMAGGPVGAAAGAYLGHKVQQAANKKPKKEELSAKQKKIDKNKNGKIDADDLRKLRGEEMTPAQKAARLQLIKKSAAKMNKRAEMDAKRAMRRDPQLGVRKSDPADHDLVHKEAVETMSHDHAKQAAHEIAKSHKNLKVTSHGNDHFVHRKGEQDGDHMHLHAKDGHIHVDHSVGVMGSQSKHKSVADAVKHGKKVGGLSESLSEDTHIVKYHDADGKHKNDSKPMTQAKAQAHAAKGNAIDKVGGKYTVHKVNEGGPGSGPQAKTTQKQVRQAIGIARDKRYAGGNYTGAHNTINKLKKGLADHPRVKDELRKQNESFLPEDNEMEKKEMMKTQLHFIKYAADEICEYIDMGGNIEEWYQNKVSKAFADFESLHSYMEGTARKDGLKEELDSQESEIDYEKKPTFSEFISKLNK